MHITACWYNIFTVSGGLSQLTEPFVKKTRQWQNKAKQYKQLGVTEYIYCACHTAHRGMTPAMRFRWCRNLSQIHGFIYEFGKEIALWSIPDVPCVGFQNTPCWFFIIGIWHSLCLAWCLFWSRFDELSQTFADFGQVYPDGHIEVKSVLCVCYWLRTCGLLATKWLHYIHFKTCVPHGLTIYIILVAVHFAWETLSILLHLALGIISTLTKIWQ